MGTSVLSNSALQNSPARMKTHRTFYEFFAGGGMVRAGLGEEWECLFANDIDTKKRASYEINWGTEHLVPGSVGNLTTAELPGNADLAWASLLAKLKATRWAILTLWECELKDQVALLKRAEQFLGR